ncbi:MAG: DEAD/DEAH box helicase [Cyclobacteriaceae bacterium]
MEKLLQHYLKRLTNLSGKNRSLLLLRLIKDQFIDLHAFDYLENKSSFDLIKALVSKKKLLLCAESDPRDYSSNTISRQLKKLNRTEEFIFQERGSRDLYIGWPYVEGRFQDNTLIRCPLLFFPVELSAAAGKWTANLRKDVNVTFNKSFLLAYAYYNEVRYDEALVETVFSDLDEDITVFRTQVYEMLKQSFISLNFNQEVFLDKLVPFKETRKDSFERGTKTGELKLQNQAVLGIFPQAGSYLVPDYLSLIEASQFEDLESFFEKKLPFKNSKTVRPSIRERVSEESTYTPFKLDAFQEIALKRIKNGESLTVQGPPGSGKSQLISNLICDYVARGKSVLLICQKKAALDVVYRRLKSKDLHDFAGIVHDFKSDRKEVFSKLENQIERLDEYKQKNNALDTIAIERTHTQSSRQIERIVEELEELKEALFDTAIAGKSVKELYLISDPVKESISVKSMLPMLRYDVTDAYFKKLRQHLQYYLKYSNKHHFWAHEKSFANYSNEDRLKIKSTLDDMCKTFDRFKEDSKKMLNKELDFDTTSFFLNNTVSFKQFITNVDNDTVYQYLLKMLDHKPSETLQWITHMERTMLQCFKGEGLESSLKPDELGRFQESVERAIKARKNPWNFLKWRFFSKDRIFITRVLVANELPANRSSFDILLKKIDNRLNYEHNVRILEQNKWLSSFPTSLRKLDAQNWFFFTKLAFKSLELYSNLRNLDAYIKLTPGVRKETVAKLNAFLGLIDQLPQHQALWTLYMTDHQIRELLSLRTSREKAIQELDRDFDNLRDWHAISESYSTVEQNVIAELEEKNLSLDDKMQCFENSVALAWIDHIETKYPVLRTVSTLRFEEMTHELRTAIQTKNEISREIVLLRSREKTLENITYNRLHNRVSFRELHHQVTKKKQIWPLRRVLSEFKEEVFKLIPCWMTSPESASALFPMEELFDLVIFDEASQCFTERGIPGMCRGKQVVVAGDSQQLKPFDLYRARWQESEEEDIAFEKDALLDLAAQYLPEVSLQGHYRSNSNELIDFSNKYFYKDRLRAIPYYEYAVTRNTVFKRIDAGGKWEHNTNQKEAEEVIRQVKMAHKENPEQSIGVVTFNAPQQSLILDLMEANIPTLLRDPALFFVKNIENVQGDERDLIIFSTAYAKDNSGKLQLRFGSLNQVGGEHRLNVAVTRAKRRIIMITSIKSYDLQADQTKNLGPKLFRDYLEYVENLTSKKELAKEAPVNKHSAEWYLKSRMISEFEIDQRYQLKEALPFVDISVLDTQKNRYSGLIRTDDDLYFDAPSIKDIYVYQPNILDYKGWPHFQTHSRRLWNQPEELGDKMRLFVHRISAFDQSGD